MILHSSFFTLHFKNKFSNIFSIGYCLSIDHQREALSLTIVLPVTVPDDGEHLAVITDSVKAEVIPIVGRDQRIDNDATVSLWTKTDKSCDDDISEC